MNAKATKNAKNATNNNPAEARQEYAKRAGDIARLIDVLQMELDQHGADAKADPKCWGKVGDIGKVRSDLIDVVAFISNSDREHIEAFLNDAE